MEKIDVYIKNQTINKDILREISSFTDDKISFQVSEEELSRKPIVHSANLDPAEIQHIIDVSKNLLGAESIVRITFETFFSIFLINEYKKAKEFIKFIFSNNKKKGNKFGVNVSIKRSIDNNEYVYDFICDGISENNLTEALSKINPTLENLCDLIGNDYITKIKRVIFIYNEDLEWKPKAIEKIED